MKLADAHSDGFITSSVSIRKIMDHADDISKLLSWLFCSVMPWEDFVIFIPLILAVALLVSSRTIMGKY